MSILVSLPQIHTVYPTAAVGAPDLDLLIGLGTDFECNGESKVVITVGVRLEVCALCALN
jgi:hypothetical protein